MSHIVGHDEVVKCDETKRSFPWEYPFFGFLASGWFVALYFAEQPGFETFMASLPAGTVLNIVSPSFYLSIAFVLNGISWLVAMMQYCNPGENK